VLWKAGLLVNQHMQSFECSSTSFTCLILLVNNMAMMVYPLEQHQTTTKQHKSAWNLFQQGYRDTLVLLKVKRINWAQGAHYSLKERKKKI